MSWRTEVRDWILGMSTFNLAWKSKILMIEGQIDYGGLNEFMGYYGHDVLASFGLYYISKLLTRPKGVHDRVVCSFLPPVIFLSFLEYMQKIHPDTPGGYSPYDFLAYTAWAGLALAIDLATSRDWRRNRNDLNTRLN